MDAVSEAPRGVDEVLADDALADDAGASVLTPETEALLRAQIRDIADYPEPGIVFRDITPLLARPETFDLAVGAVSAPFADVEIDKVLAVEARGFLFGAPVALAHRAGFVPVRKRGKLPHDTEAESYELEYGTDVLEVHRDSIAPGERVLLVDDVLATGGTAAATIRLARRLGADVVGATFLAEIAFLDGRRRLDVTVHAAVRYE